MKPLDYAKAAGVAVLVLILNVLLSIPVILFYAQFIDPGYPREYYDKAALWIAPWCSHITGTALFFVAGYLCAKRRPQRNGLQFAAVFTAFYAVIDASAGGFVAAFHIEFGLSMLAKLLASLGGAFLAARGTHKSPAAPP